MSTQRLEIAFVTPLIVAEVEPPSGGVLLSITHQRFTITADGDLIMYTLPLDHLVKMQVAYVDAGGNPAKVDGAVVWASSDAAIAAAQADPADSTICTVTPSKLGQVQITATADADLGDGVRQIITPCEVTVVAGEAVSGTIAPIGEAEPIAPHVDPRKGKR